jgi:diadenosine tetraphosphate (Ap4A) HIT family hydrolase
MRTLIHERVEQAGRGEYPKTICRAPSGWVVLGDVQFLKGYCLLLPDPVVPDLNSMSLEARAAFMRDMTLLGDSVTEVTRCKRINYEILGNSEPALHAHVFPRFEDEPEHLKKRPVWFYDWDAGPQFDLQRDGELMKAIAEKFQARLYALGLGLK